MPKRTTKPKPKKPTKPRKRVGSGNQPREFGRRGTAHQRAVDRQLEKLGYWFDVAEADRICIFFESFLRHYKGEWAGQLFTLSDWQRAFLRRLFGWRRPDGTRRYRQAFLAVPRKNGKSALAAGIALYLTMADGEAGAEVYSIATKRDQAEIVFGDAKAMVNASAELGEVATVYKSSIFCQSLLSRYQALSGSPTKHGFNVHGLIVDELHEFKARELWDAMTTGSAARRQPLFVSITTAGQSEHSLCWAEWQYAKRVADGTVEDPHYLGVIYAADEKDKWDDPRTWKKANPNLGVSVSIDFLKEEARQAADKGPQYVDRFKQFYLNIWTRESKRAISAEVWDACAGEPTPFEELGDRPVYGGLDLSRTTDLAAFVAVSPRDESDPETLLDVYCWFWVPEENADQRARKDRVPYPQWIDQGYITATPGNVVHYGRIKTDLVALASRVRLVEIAYDRTFAGELVQHLRDDHGVTMVEHGQGYYGMGQPVADFVRCATSAGFRHGGHPVLDWNVDRKSVV